MTTAVTLGGRRLDDEVGHHFAAMLRCVVPSKKHPRLLLATPPDGHCPSFVMRDGAHAARVLGRLVLSERRYDCERTAFELLRASAHFTLDAQESDGSFGHRYGRDGEPQSLWRQEEATAHALCILSTFLLVAREADKSVPQLGDFLDAIDRALSHAFGSVFDAEVGLFRSTTAGTDSALDTGYSLWTNAAYVHAARLSHEVARTVDSPNRISRSHPVFHEDLAERLDRLVVGGRWVRRLDETGRPDFRPDAALLAPTRFGIRFRPEASTRAVSEVASRLPDPELGLLRRTIAWGGCPDTRVQGGGGAWPEHAAALAQWYFDDGKDEEAGLRLLDALAEATDEDGNLPQILTTRARFESHWSDEWQTGREAERAFDRRILRNDVPFERLLAEANAMSTAYGKTRSRIAVRPAESGAPGGGTVRFGAPCLAAHAEALRAWLVAAGDWSEPGDARKEPGPAQEPQPLDASRPRGEASPADRTEPPTDAAFEERTWS